MRQRPVISLICKSCERRYLGRRVRGKFTGVVQVFTGALSHPIVQLDYIPERDGYSTKITCPACEKP